MGLSYLKKGVYCILCIVLMVVIMIMTIFFLTLLFIFVPLYYVYVEHATYNMQHDRNSRELFRHMFSKTVLQT